MIDRLEELLLVASSGTLREHLHPNVQLKSDWRVEMGRVISARVNDQNAPCAWLVVGINDDGATCGKDESWASERERILSDQFNQFLEPVYCCVLLRVVEINQSWFVVAQFTSPGTVVRWQGKPYKSVGTTCAEMSSTEVMGLTLKLPGSTDYSNQPWSGPISDSDHAFREFTARVLARHGDDPIAKNPPAIAADLCMRLGIADRMAGRILFGDLKFRVALIDRRGDVQQNLTLSPAYLLVTPAIRQTLQDWTRQFQVTPNDPYPDTALREALANALAHSAYQERDGEIIVECYPDRVEITNVCFPAASELANRWFSRAHFTFNPLLAETLRFAGDVDELGRGKSRIIVEAFRNGTRVPIVAIDRHGMYSRWRLTLFARAPDAKHEKLITRLQSLYHDDSKASLAYALILWRDKSVDEIGRYVDHDWVQPFREIVGDPRSPVFLDHTSGKLALSRWVAVLLGEGKDSKKLNKDELARLFDAALDHQSSTGSGEITPMELRRLAGMSNSPSDVTLSAGILKAWVTEGRATRLGKGRYTLTAQVATYVTSVNSYLQKLFGELDQLKIGGMHSPGRLVQTWGPMPDWGPMSTEQIVILPDQSAKHLYLDFTTEKSDESSPEPPDEPPVQPGPPS